MSQLNQPDGLDVKLFRHQIQSINDMEKLEKEKKIVYKNTYGENIEIDARMGILADIPGYGKSYSVVGMILNDKMEWDRTAYRIKIPIYFSSGITQYKYMEYKTLNCTLLVASTSIISQWEEYFENAYELVVATVTTRKDIEKIKSKGGPNKYDVIILSPQRYNEFMDDYTEYAWKRFIYDEPTSVHIPKMRSVQAGFYWFVTYTYKQLLNCFPSRHFFRDMFNNIDRDLLDHLVIKNSDDFVKASFKMPETHYLYHICTNPAIVQVLQNVVPNDIIQMIEGGNIRGAIEHLGGSTTSNTNLIELVTNKKKEELKEAEFKVSFYENKPGNKKEFENWTKKKTDLQKDIEYIQDKYKNILKEECPICRCETEEPVMTPCCNSIFCGNCIFGWVKNKMNCPMCRTGIKPKSLMYITNEEDDEKKSSPSKGSLSVHKEKELPKPDTIVRIVRSKIEEPDTRIIIFSYYDESFLQVRRALEEAKINCIEIKGSKAVKDNRLKKFRNGEEKVIFLNSFYNGAGINLEMTTDIILYQDMTEDIKSQIIGRANRMGRRGDLTVHTLLSQ